MDSNQTFRIIVIFVLVSILVTISKPVQSKFVPLSHSFVARSLLRVFPPSNSPSDSESPSPAAMDLESPSDYDYSSSSPSPTAMDLDSPSDSESPSSSPSPAAMDLDSPAASPESPSASPAAPSVSPESPSASPESPAASPEAPAMSPESPASSPEAPAASSESPAMSPQAPATSPEVSAPSLESPTDSPTDSSNEDDYDNSSPITPNGLLNPPSLSPEIKSICGNTDFPPLCESSISPLLTPLLKPDTSSVLILAIEASINATKAATAIVEKVDAVECQELYDDAVTNLEDAANAVKSRDIDTANTNLSAAMTDYGTCNDGFEESGEPNPLADVGDKLTKMVSNCLAISTLIK